MPRHLSGQRRRFGLQRLFSTFPGGWPGAGLLLLRTAVGITAVAGGAQLLMEPGAAATAGATAVAVTAIATGVALLVGFLTPAAAVLVALGSAGVTLPGCPAFAGGLLDARPATGFVIVIAVAVVLLGPGAFSLDSYFFGRREIVIPSAADHPERSE